MNFGFGGIGEKDVAQFNGVAFIVVACVGFAGKVAEVVIPSHKCRSAVVVVFKPFDCVA